MGTASERELNYSHFLICISKNLTKLKKESDIEMYKNFEKLIIRPTFLLNDKLIITHKVFA